MFSHLSRKLWELKDGATSFAFEQWAARKIEPYARMIELKIDSQTKAVTLVLQPHGEKEPIRVEIEQYELLSTVEGTKIVVRKIKVSRAWMQLLAEQFVLGRSFVIPQEYAAALRLVL